MIFLTIVQFDCGYAEVAGEPTDSDSDRSPQMIVVVGRESHRVMYALLDKGDTQRFVSSGPTQLDLL